MLRRGGGPAAASADASSMTEATPLASSLAPYGVFIVPQTSAPFRYSGVQSYARQEDERARKFREQTGIQMEPGCGIDTAAYRAEWKGVSPLCEVVCCEFDECTAVAQLAPVREQLALFGGAA